MQKYKLTKLSDDRFNGNHPNGIGEGYVKVGYIPFLPKVGERFFINSLRTSTVTEELNKDGIFKTNNSTYKLEEVNEEV